MKELYLDAEMDVVKFSIEDVINTSTSEETTASTASTNANGGMGGPNEGEFGEEWL